LNAKTETIVYRNILKQIYYLLVNKDESLEMSAEIKQYPSKSAEKQREYYIKFYAKTQEAGTQVCPVCFGQYTYFNRSHHNKSAHHKRAAALKETYGSTTTPPYTQSQISAN